MTFFDNPHGVVLLILIGIVIGMAIQTHRMKQLERRVDKLEEPDGA